MGLVSTDTSTLQALKQNLTQAKSKVQEALRAAEGDARKVQQKLQEDINRAQQAMRKCKNEDCRNALHSKIGILSQHIRNVDNGLQASKAATQSMIESIDRALSQLDKKIAQANRYLSSGGNAPLDNVNGAQINRAKFASYSLNPDHPKNRRKSEAFEKVGYDVNSRRGRERGADHIIEQLKSQLASSPATYTGTSPHGDRYCVTVPIVGPNGKSGSLFTCWQYDQGSSVPKLVTNWLRVHR